VSRGTQADLGRDLAFVYWAFTIFDGPSQGPSTSQILVDSLGSLLLARKSAYNPAWT
jgi:hypothetical protein